MLRASYPNRKCEFLSNQSNPPDLSYNIAHPFTNHQALQEISVEDRKRQLENTTSELEALEKRSSITTDAMKTAEKKLTDLQKRRKKSQAELEAHR